MMSNWFNRFIFYWIIPNLFILFFRIKVDPKKIIYITMVISYIIVTLNLDYVFAICSSNRGIKCLIDNL